MLLSRPVRPIAKADPGATAVLGDELKSGLLERLSYVINCALPYLTFTCLKVGNSRARHLASLCQIFPTPIEERTSCPALRTRNQLFD